jgi:DNA invertase Pin-like site-specific DNA recombinase
VARRLAPGEKQHIVKRYQEGASLRAIGREIGRPDVTVHRVLEARGVTFGPAKTTNQRTSPETEALVLRLYDQGSTWEQINERADITSVTLGKILKRNGRGYDRRSDAESNAEIITALYEAGHSTRAIAEMLGHGKTTVGGVTPRKSTTMRPWTGPVDLMSTTGGACSTGMARWRARLRAYGRSSSAALGRASGDSPYGRMRCAGPRRRRTSTPAAGISASVGYQVPKLVRALYADAPVSLDRKQKKPTGSSRPRNHRRKPGPPSNLSRSRCVGSRIALMF